MSDRAIQMATAKVDGSGGIGCPHCGSASRVFDSRPIKSWRAVRRRRICPSCAHRFTTYESGANPLQVARAFALLAKLKDTLSTLGPAEDL